MNEGFITTTSKLIIKNNTIYENRIIEPPKNYWFHSFILLVFVTGLTFYDVTTEKPYKWPIIIIILFWIIPHFVTIYKALFVNTWRINIPLRLVKHIEVLPVENELEEKVAITLKSGRKKIYTFRRSEAQAEKFVEAVSKELSQSPLKLAHSAL